MLNTKYVEDQNDERDIEAKRLYKALRISIQERKKEYQVNLARKHFGYFVQYMLGKKYKFTWYNKLIINKLDAFAKGKIKRLMINLPPRHGKSMLVSELLPAFLFGISGGNSEIIAASYGSGLAEANSRSVQRIIDSKRFLDIFPDVFLADGIKKTANSYKYKRTNDEFEIVDRRGKYKCGGIDGSFTGFGANFLIIDDPYKNLQEALSKARNNIVKSSYKSSLYTRLLSEGAILVIMTRWTEEDLCGELLANSELDSEEYFDVVKLPALSTDEPEDYDERKEANLPLWPDMFPLNRLLATKKAIGQKLFAGLYQQEPSPDTGAIIDPSWFKFYKILPEFTHILISWDLAFKKKEDSDFVVGQVWGVSGPNKYFIDQIRERAAFTRSLEMLVLFNAKHKNANETVIEDKANGPAIIDVIKQKMPSIIEFNPQGSKLERARAVSPMIEAGNVWLPSPDYYPDKADMVHDYIEEWKVFPFGQNDDQVDATTQALIRISTSENTWLESLLKQSNGSMEYDTNVAEEVANLFGWDLKNQSIQGAGLGLGF